MTQFLRFSLFGFIIFLFAGCNKDEYAATPPIYLDIPAINLKTDYGTEGTAHHDINTIWLFVNGDAAGVFELPAMIPQIMADGDNEIIIFPGIELSGISNLRAIYEPYDAIEFTVNVDLESQQFDTIQFSENRLTTEYVNYANVSIIESFDNAGLNFERLTPGDTSLLASPEGEPKFELNGENNGNSGLVVVDEERTRSRSSTILNYGFPNTATNIYVELTYKSEIDFTVGLIAETNSGDIQFPVTVIYPQEEWSKMYVSFLDDVRANGGAERFKFFISADLPDGEDIGKVWLDNLKVVYTE